VTDAVVAELGEDHQIAAHDCDPLRAKTVVVMLSTMLARPSAVIHSPVTGRRWT
jgi:hypothetical protein